MTEIATDYRKYLDPRTLARVHALDLRARLIVEGLMTGMHRSPHQGISVEFAQHRQYVAGDDVRHVDWKVFGKTAKIYLKQYLEETNLHLLCIVAARYSMASPSGRAGAGWWSKCAHAPAMAAARAYVAIQWQYSPGFAIFDQDLKHYIKPSSAAGEWKVIAPGVAMPARLEKPEAGR